MTLEASRHSPGTEFAPLKEGALPRLRWSVVIYPGTNCNDDVEDVLSRLYKQEVTRVWHRETSLPKPDVVMIPGGFSFGDYLRTGAIARFSPVTQAIERFAAEGGLVVGICNGFQILTEAGLLPGALLRNNTLRFRCTWVNVRVENTQTRFTSSAPKPVLRIPISHGEGRYFADPNSLAQLEADNQIILRYCSADGIVDDAHNPNGSVGGIAGICNKEGNVFALMPHPERCADPELGGNLDGRFLFDSILNSHRKI